MASEQDSFYKRVIERAHIGVYKSTANGRILLANDCLAHIFGYADATELYAQPGLVGEHFYRDSTDRERIIKRAQAGEDVVDFLCEGKRQDGRPVWFSQSASRCIDESGSEVFVGTVVDVTALFEDQDRAHNAETAYGSIFANAGVGIYRSTVDGRQLRANPALVAFNGYATEAQLLAAVNDIGAEWYVDPTRRTEFKARIARDGRVVDFISEVYRHRTRERAWVRESAWAIRDAEGRILCYEGILEDVTEQQNEQLKLAEAQARALAAEADYRSIFENVDFGVYRGTPDGVLQRANLALARINGFSTPEEQLNAVRHAGMSGRDWYIDVGRLELFRQTRNRDGYVRNFESEIRRRATGERAWISESGWLVYDKNGTVVAVEGTVLDITERRRAEVELREAKAIAEAASAAKSAFLAVMSHELRTPLNAIIGFAEIIAGRLFGPQDPRYVDYAADIHASGKHLLQLINDILDLSKIVAGRLEIFETEILLEPLYANLAKMFAGGADKAAISLGIETVEPSLVVRADSMRLQQILMNLVANAIKFTPPGGQVRLFARRANDAICLGVSDTGIGMTPDEARRAVEPFTQIDSHLARRHEGTGLGLAICKELASLHGGTLVIDSKKGSGTTVTLQLPLERVV